MRVLTKEKKEDSMSAQASLLRVLGTGESYIDDSYVDLDSHSQHRAVLFRDHSA